MFAFGFVKIFCKGTIFFCEKNCTFAKNKSMNRIKHFFLNNYWFVIGISLSLVLILLWFASQGEYYFSAMFASDALYLPSVYKDIVIDGNSVQGWTFNPAPNFFPDMLFFFILMGLTSNFVTAAVLFSTIQYFVIIALFYIIFRKISDISSHLFSVSMYLFAFILLYFLVDNDFFNSFMLMTNAYHNGMFVVSLVCVILSINFFKKESWAALIGIFILSAIMLPNDRLFFFGYICPMIFTLFVLLIAKYDKRKILKLTLVCVLSFLLGMVILDKFKHNPIFTLTSPHQNLTLEGIASSWNVFFSQMKIYLFEFSFKTLTLILSIISYILTIYYCITEFITIKQKKREISLFFIFQLFVLFFILLVLFAPIVNGNYLGFDVIRYNYYVFIVLPFNLILLANHYVKKQKYWVIGLNSFFAISFSVYLFWSILNMNFIQQLKDYSSIYPQKAQNLDKLFPQKNGVFYGFTHDYWFAKHATMFSRKNIRVYPGGESAMPYLHVTNENWFFGGGKGKYSNPQFTFLVWDKDTKLPDFFLEHNPPYKSYPIDEDKILYFVRPFIFDKSTMQPKLILNF